MRRVSGHALLGEGAPYRCTSEGRAVREGWYGGTGGKGSALCQCGAMSDELDSVTKRKAWHRAHKAEVLG